MQQSFYVSLDLGSSQCYQSVINSDGALALARSIPTSEHHLRAAFAHLHGDVRVHLEAGVGSLKDVSRKVFEAARRTKTDNSFKQFYEMSLANTKNQVHARLSTQRKILATLRAMWISNQPFQNDSG